MKTKKESHRKPPKPEAWNCKRGTCRFCGEPIIENGTQNNRKHWHAACAKVWNVMNDPKEARRVVHRRDKFTCVECGFHDRNYQFDVDHIKPLFEANGDHSYWQLPNLRLLCKECHKVKTREDMARYHAARRANEESSQDKTADPDLAILPSPNETQTTSIE